MKNLGKLLKFLLEKGVKNSHRRPGQCNAFQQSQLIEAFSLAVIIGSTMHKIFPQEVFQTFSDFVTVL